jgi:hypothetical protein
MYDTLHPIVQSDESDLQAVWVSPEKRLDNTLKTAAYAARLYPAMQWVPIEPSIFIAQSRLPKNSNQRDILEKELIQARFLVSRGSTVYLLVEEHYRKSRKKAARIFFKIDSDLSQEAVLRKLIDRIRKGNNTGGLIIAHFTCTGKTYFWEEDRIK